MDEERQQLIQDFERNRNQLMAVSSQKNQLQFQSKALGEALSELDKTKEKKVYKAVGNILILSEVPKVKKDISTKKESIDLKIKTMQKQEDITVDKLNKLKSKLEPTKEETTEDKK